MKAKECDCGMMTYSKTGKCHKCRTSSLSSCRPFSARGFMSNCIRRKLKKEAKV